MFQALARQFCKDALYRVQPCAGCRDEVECPPWLPYQPVADIRLLKGGIVIENDLTLVVLGISASIVLRNLIKS